MSKLQTNLVYKDYIMLNLGHFWNIWLHWKQCIPLWLKSNFLFTVPSNCCTEKQVGNVTYVLVEKGDTTGYNCTENCIFEEKQKPGSRFCFKDGEQPVTCLEENGSIISNNCIIIITKEVIFNFKHFGNNNILRHLKKLFLANFFFSFFSSKSINSIKCHKETNVVHAVFCVNLIYHIRKTCPTPEPLLQDCEDMFFKKVPPLTVYVAWLQGPRGLWAVLRQKWMSTPGK